VQSCAELTIIYKNFKKSTQKLLEPDHLRKFFIKIYIKKQQKKLNIKGVRNYRLKPVELSSLDEAMKQEAFGSLTQR